jgi:hypothetical protein
VALLASSRAFKPIVPEQLIAIAGYGQPTVVNAEHNNDQFIYQITHDGDGTVPLASAAMEGRDSLYCEVLHGELPRSPLVHESILQLLAGESANTLTRSPPATTSSAAMQSDAGLRTLMLDKINWSQLDLAARRQFLDSLNAPPRSLP